MNSEYTLEIKILGAVFQINWNNGQVQGDRELIASLDRHSRELEDQDIAVGPIPAGLSPLDWRNGTGFYFLCQDFAEAFEPSAELNIESGDIPLLEGFPSDVIY